MNARSQEAPSPIGTKKYYIKISYVESRINEEKGEK